MEEIGKQYINAKTRAGFQTALDSGKVSDSQVAFIEDEDLIWARGKYYGTIPNEEDLTKDTEGKLQLSDRSYNPENFSGLGRIILRKNMSAGKNILTQEMISQANTVYEIRYDFDLSGATINIPENCTLDFQGGSLKNGTLNGNNTKILSDYYDYIFKDLVCLGKWDVNKASVCWFGVKKVNYPDHKNTRTCEYFKKSLISNFDTFYIPSGYYYVDETFIINKPITLLMDGVNVEMKELTSRSEDKDLNKTILFTDKNINIIEVSYSSGPFPESFNIIGGCIDTSSILNNYTSTAIHIKVDNGFKLWGGELKTTIIGWNNKDLLNSNSKAIHIEAFGDDSYCVDLKINSIIRGYTIGILINKGSEGSSFVNSITEGSAIVFCCVAFKSIFGDYFNLVGDYQSTSYFKEDDLTPFIYIGGDNNYINCKIWDLNQLDNKNNLYSNRVGVETAGANTFIDSRLLNILQVNNLTKGIFSDRRVWLSYNNKKYDYNYLPTDNFFILNRYFTYEVESNSCEVKNLDRVFKNNSIYYSSVEKSTKSSNVKIKIKINKSGVDNYGDLPVLSTVGIVLSAYSKSYYSKVKIDVLEKTSIITSKIFEVKGKLDAVPIDINLSSSAEYIKFDEINILLYDFVTDNSGYNSVQIYKVYGKTFLNLENYLTTAGGDFFGEYTKKGLLFIDNKKHSTLSEISGNYAINAITEVNGESVIFNKNKWEYISKDQGGLFINKPKDNLRVGMSYFCTDKNAPGESNPGIMIYYKGNNVWVDSNGVIVDETYPTLKKGTTAQRPTGVQIGYTYKDTDQGKWIIWGGDVWENIDGSPLE